MAKATCRSIAKKIQDRLLDEGFIVHRYDAYSSNSIYLKLDYGVAHSVRISDHSSRKKHLRYRYNVVTFVDRPYLSARRGKHPMYIYSPNDIDKLIDQIIRLKIEDINRYSVEGYKKKMEFYKKEYTKSKFWRSARRVKSKRG